MSTSSGRTERPVSRCWPDTERASGRASGGIYPLGYTDQERSRFRPAQRSLPMRRWQDRRMDQRPVSSETLAAQGLGEADPVTGGLASVINLSTNYEQQPDGSYRQGRVYTRSDNPTSEHAEQMLAALEGVGLGDG